MNLNRVSSPMGELFATPDIREEVMPFLPATSLITMLRVSRGAQDCVRSFLDQEGTGVNEVRNRILAVKIVQELAVTTVKTTAKGVLLTNFCITRMAIHALYVNAAIKNAIAFTIHYNIPIYKMISLNKYHNLPE